MHLLVWTCYAALSQLYCIQLTILDILLETGVLSMASHLQPPGDAQLSKHTEDIPRLPCAEYLQAYFEDGGLDQKTFQLLSRMIEMISAIGREVHVVHQSKIPGASSAAYVEKYMDCTIQGCAALDKTSRRAFLAAREAKERLPALTGVLGGELNSRLSQWRSRLR